MQKNKSRHIKRDEEISSETLDFHLLDGWHIYDMRANQFSADEGDEVCIHLTLTRSVLHDGISYPIYRDERLRAPLEEVLKYPQLALAIYRHLIWQAEKVRRTNREK